MKRSPEDAAQLRRAADYLRDRGWATNQAGGYGAPACMAGAIRTVRSLDHDVLSNHLRQWVLLVCGTTTVIDFNDNHCRSSHDAIAALEIAADLAEAGWDHG